MAFTNPTPNMSLPVPVTGMDPGPDWANNYNACFTLVDAHNHSPGYGAPVTPSGLQITSDLTFLGHRAFDLFSTAYFAQPSAINTSTYPMNLYAVGANGELYWE